ncbi:MAG: tetratricopeptide repeat protein [Fusobacteria bacterium]|nr:tetratricopeptide repeat protein [Fusobacteriota bacterium]
MKKIWICAVIAVTVIFVGCTSTTTTQNGNLIPTAKQVSQKQKDEVYALVKGNNYLRIGELNEAINQYQIAYNINPTNIETLNQIGVLYGESGNFSKSQDYLNKAYVLDKTNEETLYNLSYLYYIQKNYSVANSYIIQIQPQDYSKLILKLKFALSIKNQNYEVSYGTFNTLLKYNDVLSPTEYNQYIIVLKKIGKSSEVYPFLVTLNKTFSNNEAITLYFADYFISNGAYSNAGALLKEYGLKNGYTDAILLKLSIVTYDQKNYIQALNYLSLVSKSGQYNQEILVQKIAIYTAMGQTQKAKELKQILGVSYESTN